MSDFELNPDLNIQVIARARAILSETERAQLSVILAQMIAKHLLPSDGKEALHEHP